MTIVTTSHLVGELRQLQLLGPVYEEELTSTLAGRFAEPRSLAQELVRRGWLTTFQANLLFNGRGRELILGQYILLERLGEGGMGQVYKARHRMLKRIDAVKVIKPERLADPGALDRFRREMEAAARLRHPNLVTVYNADQVGNIQYLAMEYLEGSDLGKLVKSQPRGLPVGQACDYVRQACLGLQHAHEHRLIHRDIKPTNLQVTLAGEGHAPSQGVGTVKVLDLGLARVETPSPGDEGGTLTAPGALMGTPDYMSPEQIDDPRLADARSDVYSMGCTLYHLLSGHAPFAGGHWTEKLRQHREGKPMPVQKARPDVPAGVTAVLDRMMAKCPADRHQTPLEVALALADFCEAPQAVAVTPVRGSRRGSEFPPSTAPGELPQAIISTEQRARTLGGTETTPEAPLRRGHELVPDEQGAVPARGRLALLSVGGLLLLGGLLFAGIKLAGSKDSGPEDDQTPPATKPPEDDRPTVIVAAQGGDFTSIHAALADDRVKDGMRIRVRPGVYTDPLILHKNVELVGDGPRANIVVKCKDARCLVILAESAAVRGLTIRAAKPTNEDSANAAVEISKGQAVVEDCDFSSRARACVAVYGTTAKPTFKKCVFHDGEMSGLYVTRGGQPVVEDCEFFDNAQSHVEVTEGGAPLFRRCKLHGGQGSGIRVRQKASGRFEDCDVYATAIAGVSVLEESTPTFVRCKFRDGKQGGVFILDKGAGTFEDCEVFNNLKAGVEIKGAGCIPVLRGCKIHTGKSAGVLVHQGGAGTFAKCEIYSNTTHGLTIYEASDPSFKGCKIHDNKQCGALVLDSGKGTFVDCDIYGHLDSGVWSGKKGNPTLRGCRINRNVEFGVVVAKDGEATVHDCDLTGNRGPAIGSAKGAVIRLANNKE